MKNIEKSGTSVTDPGKGCTNEGHPVPESYFAEDANNGLPQPAHLKVPFRFSLFKGLSQFHNGYQSTWNHTQVEATRTYLEKGNSVPSSLKTRYCCFVRICCHSSVVCEISPSLLRMARAFGEANSPPTLSAEALENSEKDAREEATALAPSRTARRDSSGYDFWLSR